jgi:pilus assembly protein CpaE
MRFGIQEFLSMPLSSEAVVECCGRVRLRLAQAPSKVACTDLVFSFLPAKAGVGASTIAANCSILAAQQMDGRVFLGDFDLNSGIVRFLLRVATPYSIVDAVKRTTELDGGQWAQIVESRGNLDIVHAGNIDLDTRVDPSEVRHLLDFARRSYKMVCADLSGNLEKFSLEIMRESKLIFLVTTPELPALYLAREKVRLLERLDLFDRVAVVVNRYAKRQPMSVADIEGIVSAPVMITLPNDYLNLHSAIQRGSAVDASSPLGKHYWELAKRMVSPPTVTKPQRKRFLEHFAIAPAR